MSLKDKMDKSAHTYCTDSLYYIQDTPVYSSEEKALMAEILRDDHLNERREKARREDFKLHDAKQRRMFRVAQADALEKEG